MVQQLDKVDVVTVGVGWTGGIIAAELAKAGYNVVGLERGAEQKTEDFLQTKDELRFDSRYELLQNLSNETVTFRNTPDMTALPMREYGAFQLGTGLGGDGVHWSGVTWRFLPYDFEIQSQTVEKYGEDKIPEDMALQDWGITYEELEPYYDTFEKTAGISGEENPFGGFRSDDYPTPPMKETPALRLFKETTTEMGYQPFMAPSANPSETYTNPDGKRINQCQYCSYCSRYGCDFGAKSDPIVTVIPTALETNNFELRTYSNVTEVLHEDGVATGVRYTDLTTGVEYEQPADVVVLTSYVLNNARLLLQSELGQPYDPETQTGSVGKNYCYQLEFSGQGFFEKQYNMHMGAGDGH
ncbi:choline dehydrogenase-like flavoprotein [Geomicrobium sediminis]|uniref:Choline dehydrogenase-like flavoprotein n=1 Tax=Geomicrobium sediminis TaxID=1347788 RepID=A0ABS2PFJ3_9BACL|nr:choline dehydrogenase-like flavoprotein [Geomicrobium sediminis]